MFFCECYQCKDKDKVVLDAIMDILCEYSQSDVTTKVLSLEYFVLYWQSSYVLSKLIESIKLRHYIMSHTYVKQ